MLALLDLFALLLGLRQSPARKRVSRLWSEYNAIQARYEVLIKPENEMLTRLESSLSDFWRAERYRLEGELTRIYQDIEQATAELQRADQQLAYAPVRLSIRK